MKLQNNMLIVVLTTTIFLSMFINQKFKILIRKKKYTYINDGLDVFNINNEM